MNIQPTATATRTYSLEFKWTVSRGRDTYGYNICTLYVDGRKVSRCNGGGYDMKGTCLGTWIAQEFADELRALTPADMPPQSHWQRAERPRRICRNCASHYAQRATLRPSTYIYTLTCPQCASETHIDYSDGERVDLGRYFYGLTFHDPNYDPSKAVIGTDCTDRTLGDGAAGQTVAEAEAAGVSFGLERLQAVYSASSKHATERHTVPRIDGACGWSSVEQIARAIGLEFEYHATRSKKIDLWTVRTKGGPDA